MRRNDALPHPWLHSGIHLTFKEFLSGMAERVSTAVEIKANGASATSARLLLRIRVTPQPRIWSGFPRATRAPRSVANLRVPYATLACSLRHSVLKQREPFPSSRRCSYLRGVQVSPFPPLALVPNGSPAAIPAGAPPCVWTLTGHFRLLPVRIDCWANIRSGDRPALCLEHEARGNRGR